MMRGVIAIVMVVGLGACTSAAEVRKDLDDLRELVRADIGRQAEGIAWRDAEVLQIQQQRVDAHRRAADGLAHEGDLEAAEALWQAALEILDAFQPAHRKLQRLREARDQLRAAPQPGAPMIPNT